MLIDVTGVDSLPNYCLQVRFEDKTSGIIDVRQLIPFEGVFEQLEDPAYFEQVGVHSELGTVCWPNGADLDSDVLYSIITGEPYPDYEMQKQL